MVHVPVVERQEQQEQEARAHTSAHSRQLCAHPQRRLTGCQWGWENKSGRAGGEAAQHRQKETTILATLNFVANELRILPKKQQKKTWWLGTGWVVVTLDKSWLIQFHSWGVKLTKKKKQEKFSKADLLERGR